MRGNLPRRDTKRRAQVRAMQIISELEQTQRALMAGAWVIFRSMAISIAASHRTALIKDGKAYVQAGGGWVNDRRPKASSTRP